MKMQDKSKILRKSVSEIVNELRNSQDKEYLKFCDENSIATSTYDNVINGVTNVTFYNLSKFIKGLGISFKEFGELLDKRLPKEFWDEE